MTCLSPLQATRSMQGRAFLPECIARDPEAEGAQGQAAGAQHQTGPGRAQEVLDKAHATLELLKPVPLHARLLGAPGAHKTPDQTTVSQVRVTG